MMMENGRACLPAGVPSTTCWPLLLGRAVWRFSLYRTFSLTRSPSHPSSTTHLVARSPHPIHPPSRGVSPSPPHPPAATAPPTDTLRRPRTNPAPTTPRPTPRRRQSTGNRIGQTAGTQVPICTHPPFPLPLFNQQPCSNNRYVTSDKHPPLSCMMLTVGHSNICNRCRWTRRLRLLRHKPKPKCRLSSKRTPRLKQPKQ